MKGIVFDVKRGSVKDGPGIRTSVFFKGCPLRCIWCHNPESWLPEPEPDGTAVIGREVSVEALMKEILVDRIFYRTSGGGVTLTGGEPMMQFPFLRELLAAAKAEKGGVPGNSGADRSFPLRLQSGRFDTPPGADRGGERTDSGKSLPAE